MKNILKVFTLVFVLFNVSSKLQSSPIGFFQAIASGQFKLPFIKTKGPSINVDTILKKVADANPERVLSKASMVVGSRKGRSAASAIVGLAKEVDATTVANVTGDLLYKVQNADTQKVLQSVENALNKVRTIDVNKVEEQCAKVVRQLQRSTPNVIIRRISDLIRSKESLDLAKIVISLVKKYGPAKIKTVTKALYNAKTMTSVIAIVIKNVSIFDALKLRRAGNSFKDKVSWDSILQA